MIPSATQATEAAARANVCGFLARVLGAPPDAEAVRRVRDLARELGLPCPGEISLAAVDQDYMDLFVVPGPRYVAPYESVFRDECELAPGLAPAATPVGGAGRRRGLLMGESTVRVRECFVEAGVAPQSDLPDHIANELRLMAHLLERTSRGGAAEASLATRLLGRLRREHLERWVHDLGQAVAECEAAGFYSVAIAVADTVVRDDVADLTDE